MRCSAARRGAARCHAVQCNTMRALPLPISALRRSALARMIESRSKPEVAERSRESRAARSLPPPGPSAAAVQAQLGQQGREAAGARQRLVCAAARQGPH